MEALVAMVDQAVRADLAEREAMARLEWLSYMLLFCWRRMAALLGKTATIPQQRLVAEDFHWEPT